jgi:hypothetical protein
MYFSCRRFCVYVGARILNEKKSKTICEPEAAREQLFSSGR